MRTIYCYNICITIINKKYEQKTSDKKGTQRSKAT